MICCPGMKMKEIQLQTNHISIFGNYHIKPRMTELQQFEENYYYTFEVMNESFSRTQQQESVGVAWSKHIEQLCNITYCEE